MYKSPQRSINYQENINSLIGGCIYEGFTVYHNRNKEPLTDKAQDFVQMKK